MTHSSKNQQEVRVPTFNVRPPQKILITWNKLACAFNEKTGLLKKSVSIPNRSRTVPIGPHQISIAKPAKRGVHKLKSTRGKWTNAHMLPGETCSLWGTFGRVDLLFYSLKAVTLVKGDPMGLLGIWVSPPILSNEKNQKFCGGGLCSFFFSLFFIQERRAAPFFGHYCRGINITKKNKTKKLHVLGMQSLPATYSTLQPFSGKRV